MSHVEDLDENRRLLRYDSVQRNRALRIGIDGLLIITLDLVANVERGSAKHGLGKGGR